VGEIYTVTRAVLL